MVDTGELFAKSARLIAQAAAGSSPVSIGMGDWFRYCEQVAPEHLSLWQRLRTLDFESDQERLTGWLTSLFQAEPPPRTINGLWFGLHNPILDDEPSCQLYVSGSSSFDPARDSDEWVCQTDWWPNGRYSHSEVLAELYRAINGLTENDASYLGEPFLCHGYVALLVSEWCHGPVHKLLLGEAGIRAVAMGHDSGDFYRMAVLQTATS